MGMARKGAREHSAGLNPVLDLEFPLVVYTALALGWLKHNRALRVALSPLSFGGIDIRLLAFVFEFSFGLFSFLLAARGNDTLHPNHCHDSIPSPKLVDLSVVNHTK